MRLSKVRGQVAMCYGTIRVLAFVIGLLVCVLGTPFETNRAYAQFLTSPTIFDVRRSLPLEPDEAVTHDFYINAGPELGLKKGSFINVVRPVPVHDPIQNKQQATLNIPIGKLQIIHVEKNLAVGRLRSELTDDERPTVEFEAIMIGDRVDLASITNEAPTKKRARQTAKAPQLQPEQQPEPVRIAEPAVEKTPVGPASNPAPQPTKVPAPPQSPTSAESEDPGPPLVKKPFPVAQAPDMLRLEQLESDFY